MHRPFVFILLFLLFLPFPLVSQWKSVGPVDSFSVRGPNRLIFFSGETVVQVHVLSQDLVRIRMAPGGRFEDDDSYAVTKKEWPVIKPEIRVDEEWIDMRTGEVVVRVKRKPLRISFLDPAGTTINEDDERKGMSWDASEVRAWKKMPPDESYYGFGEKAGRLVKKFAHMTMWNSDIPGYKADTDPLYESIPFFYGIRSGRTYGVFFDNSSMSSFDMGKESFDRYSFGATSGEMNYYFFYGPSPQKVISRFTELVGRMPLPPLWSLGYQQCRWSYAPESRVREIARNFRQRKIPADVLYLDIDYMEGYRIFTWSKKNFPDPGKMIRDLTQEGFKIAVIVDPGIKRDTSYHAFRSGLAGGHFLRYPDGKLYIGKVWPGECAFPDFSSPAARRWWGDQFKVLVDAGVRGWWNDMNEPSVFDVPTKTVDLDVVHNDGGRFTSHLRNHNLYGMQMTEATYEGVRKLLPAERPFVLTRASYAGGHRYSAAWTGDNVASWEHLQMSVPMCLNLSISGQPFVGPDIGGFIGYPSGELFARWLQLGVFTPLMRAHSVINEKNKEPWEFGPEFEAINRKTIELRYTFLPYIYNAMVQTAENGIPPMRPLAFAYPDDEHLAWNDSEFMFGDDLLIAPVLWDRAVTRSLRLPAGDWYDWWTGKHYKGGEWVTVDAPIDRIPVFAKAGAIIPTQQVVQYVGEQPIDPLTLTVFPAPSSETTYYEDDGRTFGYQKGEYYKKRIRQTTKRGKRSLHVSKTTGNFLPPKRSLVVRFTGVSSPPREVRFGSRLLAQGERKQFAKVSEGWYFDASSEIVVVKVGEMTAEMSVTVE